MVPLHGYFVDTRHVIRVTEVGGEAWGGNLGVLLNRRPHQIQNYTQRSESSESGCSNVVRTHQKASKETSSEKTQALRRPRQSMFEGRQWPKSEFREKKLTLAESTQRYRQYATKIERVRGVFEVVDVEKDGRKNVGQ